MSKLAPSVVEPLPSIEIRAAESLRLMVPVPPIVWAPPLVLLLSKVRMPPFATLTAPLRVSPLAIRSRELAVLVRSSAPSRVTPLRKLLALLEATTLPVVPVVPRVPPVMLVPNWSSTLPLDRVIAPPVLLMLLESRIEAVTAEVPTLIVPELVVPPPLSRFSRNALMSSVPALVKFRIAWLALMSTVLPLLMVAVSAAPGTALQDQSPEVPQSPPLGPAQVQVAPCDNPGQAAIKSGSPARRLALARACFNIDIDISPSKPVFARRGRNARAAHLRKAMSNFHAAGATRPKNQDDARLGRPQISTSRGPGGRFCKMRRRDAVITFASAAVQGRSAWPTSPEAI